MTLTDHPKFGGSELRMSSRPDLVAAFKVFESRKDEFSCLEAFYCAEMMYRQIRAVPFLPGMIQDSTLLHIQVALRLVLGQLHRHQECKVLLLSVLVSGTCKILSSG